MNKSDYKCCKSLQPTLIHKTYLYFIRLIQYSSTFCVGIVAFEMEYGHWVEEQNKQICELRNALNTHITDVELRILVDGGMKHYFDLFQLKAGAAKADVFYLMSGMWKTSAERFFLWIGGFRPSELLKVIHFLSLIRYLRNIMNSDFFFFGLKDNIN